MHLAKHNVQDMYLNPEIKRKIFEEFSPKKDPKDTGSVECQVALLTYRIKRLSDHLKEHIHDYSTKRAMLSMIGRRRKLLKYLKRKDINRYRELIQKLGIRG